MSKFPRMPAIVGLIMLVPRDGLPCNDIEILNGWVREPPPVVKVAAGYFTLRNTGKTAATIVRIEGSCCSEVVMHENIITGDQVHMSHISKLVVPAHGTSSFMPGGAHLMLINPRRPLRHGLTVDLEFFCADGGTLSTVFNVVADR